VLPLFRQQARVPVGTPVAEGRKEEEEKEEEEEVQPKKWALAVGAITRLMGKKWAHHASLGSCMSLPEGGHVVQSRDGV
jgi:hypothetical protein